MSETTIVITDRTTEHAARRFRQMASIERELTVKGNAIASCKDHLKELTKEYDGLILQLRAAARDEGDLPGESLTLFDGLDDGVPIDGDA